MLETTGQQLQRPSNGHQRTETKVETKSLNKIVDNGWHRGQCFKGEACSFKHDFDKTGKVKANVIDEVLLRQDHDHRAKTENGA